MEFHFAFLADSPPPAHKRVIVLYRKMDVKQDFKGQINYFGYTANKNRRYPNAIIGDFGALGYVMGYNCGFNHLDFG